MPYTAWGRSSHDCSNMDTITLGVALAAAFGGAAIAYVVLSARIEQQRQSLAATRDLLDKARQDVRDAV